MEYTHVEITGFLSPKEAFIADFELLILDSFVGKRFDDSYT